MFEQSFNNVESVTGKSVSPPTLQSVTGKSTITSTEATADKNTADQTIRNSPVVVWEIDLFGLIPALSFSLATMTTRLPFSIIDRVFSIEERGLL